MWFEFCSRCRQTELTAARCGVFKKILMRDQHQERHPPDLNRHVDNACTIWESRTECKKKKKKDKAIIIPRFLVSSELLDVMASGLPTSP